MYRAQCGIAGQFVTHEVGFGFTFVIFDQRAAREITIRGQYAPKEANLTASPRFGFGTAKRWGDGEKNGTGKTPGPGAYVV